MPIRAKGFKVVPMLGACVLVLSAGASSTAAQSDQPTATPAPAVTAPLAPTPQPAATPQTAPVTTTTSQTAPSGQATWTAGPSAAPDVSDYSGVVDSPSTGATVPASGSFDVNGWFVDKTAQGWAG